MGIPRRPELARLTPGPGHGQWRARFARSASDHAVTPTAAWQRRSAGLRAVSSEFSVTDGDVALEIVNDHHGRSGMTGLVCCISVRSPRAGYVPAFGRAGRAIPMTHSTRLDVRVPTNDEHLDWARAIDCRGRSGRCSSIHPVAGSSPTASAATPCPARICRLGFALAAGIRPIGCSPTCTVSVHRERTGGPGFVTSNASREWN